MKKKFLFWVISAPCTMVAFGGIVSCGSPGTNTAAATVAIAPAKTTAQTAQEKSAKTISVIKDNIDMTEDPKKEVSGAVSISNKNNMYVVDYNFLPIKNDDIKQEIGYLFSSKIAQIYKSDSGVDRMRFVVNLPVVDKLGNLTWTTYLSFDFTRAIDNKINWDNFDGGNLVDAADNVLILG